MGIDQVRSQTGAARKAHRLVAWLASGVVTKQGGD